MNEMEEFSMKAMQEYCDKLSEDGKKLSVYWKAEEEDGDLWVLIDDEEINDPSPIELDILRVVEFALGYGNKRDSYLTEGTVIYDPDKKCFFGTDNYCLPKWSEVECSVDICFPRGLWFNSITISVSGERDCNIEVSVSMFITHAKIPKSFELVRSLNEEQLAKVFSEKLSITENYYRISESIDIPKTSFKVIDSLQCYTIKKLTYEYRKFETREMYIPITENPNS
ncbi:hypothetical protein [Taibaiella koreensis]|uniref:hypothetical protein n=1 Tax=Taibaiella koreensis TaxID=1268548 RepID=UPI000E5A094B|nr:hypothetical protein [Taibaiella koreensis]